MRTTNFLDIETLALRLDRDGLTGYEDELRAVATRALRAGITPILARIVASPDEPAVARLRALGRIAAFLAATPDDGDLARVS